MPERRKANVVARTLVMLLIVAGAAIFVVMRLQQHALIQEENRAVEFQNEGQYEKAIDAYTGLLPRLDGEAAQRVSSSIAHCYVELAEDPSLPFDKALTLYRKAYSFDEEAVTNPAILKRIEGTPEKG